MITVEPDGETAHGSCPDCGETTRSVWGYVSNENGARAVYYIRWTDGHLERGAQMLVSIGSWGTGALPTNRSSFGLECQVGGEGPGFMLVDAAALPWGREQSLGEKLTRTAAIAHPLKAEIFEIVDCVLEEDHRFRDFLQGRTGGRARPRA